MQIKNKQGTVLCEVAEDSLVGAGLLGAFLCEADLRGADLRGADLRGADLEEADLRGASLRNACLGRAELRGADLRGANLHCVDFNGADLSNSDLRGANLRGASLRWANLGGAILPLPITPAGEFVAYKKVQQKDCTHTVITLRIPADAQRTSTLTSRKCRASHVVVVEGEGFSPTFDEKLHYTPGKTVYANGFDSDRREECTQGVHFFLTREEAAAYKP